jgi:hypothetical protein
MIAEMFRDRDWEGANAPNVKEVIDGLAAQGWLAIQSPRDAVQPVRLAKQFGQSIGVKQFQDSRLRVILEHHLLESLFWGLSNPSNFEVWYADERTRFEARLPEMRRAGLNVEEQLPTLPQFLKDSTQILRDYERDVSPLPPIPPRLLADARALGWKMED